MISTAQAEALIMQHTPLPVAVRMPLALAVGHGLAEAVPAERDHPPFDRITHDGIALDARAAGDARLFAIESYAAAGAPRQTLRDVANCIEVATGAPLPYTRNAGRLPAPAGQRHPAGGYGFTGRGDYRQHRNRYSGRKRRGDGAGMEKTGNRHPCHRG
jgi:hypothetical protein